MLTEDDAISAGSVDPLSKEAFELLLGKLQIYTEETFKGEIAEKLKYLETLFKRGLSEKESVCSDVLYKAKKHIKLIESSYFKDMCPKNFKRYIKRPIEKLWFRYKREYGSHNSQTFQVNIN